MSWANPKGFNFRSTAAFVTDGANETSVLTSTTYPTTRTINGESVTFGWEAGTIQARDRTTAAGDSPELSGINFFSATATFRVDLPAAGNYNISLALGDASSAQGTWWEIEDTTTVLTTIGSATTATGGADHFYDASGNQWSSGSAWKSSAVPFAGAFSTTILRLAGLDTTFQPNNVIAHLDITPVASGGSTFNESGSDSLGLADSVSNVGKFNASGSDSLALAGSAANTARLLASGSDSLALSANATGLRTTFANVSDSLGLSVSAAAQATLRPSGSDALALADSVAVQGGAPVSAPTGPTPAGSSRRHRRRAYVEIDGQRFEVDGPEHARALLDRARDVAARHAQELAAQAVVKRRRGKRPIALATPRIESPDPELAPVITQARKAINKLYRDTAIDTELAALMAEHLAREDEDEEILLLM